MHTASKHVQSSGAYCLKYKVQHHNSKSVTVTTCLLASVGCVQQLFPCCLLVVPDLHICYCVHSQISSMNVDLQGPSTQWADMNMRYLAAPFMVVFGGKVTSMCICLLFVVLHALLAQARRCILHSFQPITESRRFSAGLHQCMPAVCGFSFIHCQVSDTPSYSCPFKTR